MCLDSRVKLENNKPFRGIGKLRWIGTFFGFIGFIGFIDFIDFIDFIGFIGFICFIRLCRISKFHSLILEKRKIR